MSRSDPLPPSPSDFRSQKERMLAGDLYCATDPELAEDSLRATAWMARYNGDGGADPDGRDRLLKDLLGEVGSGVVIRPPFYCDYGYNIRIGAGAFLNFGCTVLDVVSVSIGEKAQIGPGVQLLAADHPRDAALRNQMLEYGRPIVIGRNVWIGGGATILPGVTIGDDAIVGAGAVVTRDVPGGATVVGVPARPVTPAAP